jgi:hypothetical protein
MPPKLVQLSKPSRNPPPPKPPQSGPASNTRSRASPSFSSQLPATQPVTAEPTRKEPKDSEKEAANPNPLEEDEANSSSESSFLHTIAEALDKAISEHQMSEQLKELFSKIRRYANKAMVKQGKKDILQITIEDIRDVRKDLLTDISGIYSTLDNKIEYLADGQLRLLKATEALAKEAKGINTAAKEIETKVTSVNDTTNTIASTTTKYQDTLLSQPTQLPVAMSDLRLRDDLERKAKQILVKVHSNELQDKSQSAIKDKANEAITKIEGENYGCPERVEVESVSTMWNSTLLLMLNSKQAADWLKDPGTETKFTNNFANDTFFINRSYNIIVPYTPITFNPSNDNHLREIEEHNKLSNGIIRKACWIKPAGRRREGQTHAYASLAISSPSAANQLIKNGITICGVTSSPFKNEARANPMHALQRLGALCNSMHK